MICFSEEGGGGGQRDVFSGKVTVVGVGGGGDRGIHLGACFQGR